MNNNKKKHTRNCHQNRFGKIVKLAIHTDSKKSQTKTKYLTIFSVKLNFTIAHNIIYMSQIFKQVPATTFTILEITQHN